MQTPFLILYRDRYPDRHVYGLATARALPVGRVPARWNACCNKFCETEIDKSRCPRFDPFPARLVRVLLLEAFYS